MIVPAGGTTGQVLVKTSGSDYDTGWSVPQLVGGAARPLNSSGAFLDGTNGLVLKPVASNFASTPDSAALDITGDIDIKAKVTMTDWTPTSQKYVVSKYQTDAQRSYSLIVATNGRLILLTSPDGTGASTLFGQSTVSTGVADGDTKWVRATLDVDNGSSQKVYKFYTSDDGTTWTQLGTTVTSAGTTSIFNSNSQLEVGSFSAAFSATAVWDGTIHRVIIQSAFDTADNTTSVAFDANFATQTADALAFTESSTNAATVTINTTRYLYGIPNTGFSASSLRAIAENIDYYDGFLVTEPLIVDLMAFEVTTAPVSTATVYVAFWAATDDYQPTGSPIAAWGPISVASGVTATYQNQISPFTLPPGTYVLGITTSVAFTARAYRRQEMVSHTLGATAIVAVTTQNRTSGPFPNPSEGWNARSLENSGRATYVLLRWRPA